MTTEEQLKRLVSGFPHGTKLVTFPHTKAVELIFSQSNGTVLREIRVNMGRIEYDTQDKES